MRDAQPFPNSVRPDTEVWLDFDQAIALLGLSAPHFRQLIETAALRVRDAPSGRPGVMKGELLAWHRRDLALRRAALAEFACAIDREVFG